MTHAETLDPTREERGPRILARTFYRELEAQGFTPRQIQAFADEILTTLRERLEAPHRRDA